MKISKKNTVIDTEKLKNATKSAAKTLKEKAEKISKTAQQAYGEGTQIYMQVFEPTKLEKLAKEKTELKKKILTKEAFLHILEKNNTPDYNEITKTSKELVLAQQRLNKITEKYNNFAARQEACQKAFEELNVLN